MHYKFVPQKNIVSLNIYEISPTLVAGWKICGSRDAVQRNPSLLRKQDAQSSCETIFLTNFMYLLERGWLLFLEICFH